MTDDLTLFDCLQATAGLLNGDNDRVLPGVSIDTRTLKPGELFIAIRGERYDGHDFIDTAVSAGAGAVMVSKPVDCAVPVLRVQDTVEALGLLARYWAKRFSIPTVAVTGSNGKTTVKEIITAILSQLGPVLSTQGNLNNELGVPLTLLRMRRTHLYAVIEMGASRVGDIAKLIALATPDVAVVTHIGTAHLEGFGSVEGIARGKSEIFAGVEPGGYAIVNADDDYAPLMRKAADHCIIREFSRAKPSDVQAQIDHAAQSQSGYRLSIKTKGEVLTPRFQLGGEHNAMNAAAAVAAVQCFDVQSRAIIEGLESVSPIPGRLQRKPGLNGSVIIDDSYNANPDSVRSAIQVLSTLTGQRLLVLGDMAELGENERHLHYSIGCFARKVKLDGLYGVGPLARAAVDGFNAENAVGRAEHFGTQALLVDGLKHLLTQDVTVLVKGSRSAQMDRVVGAIVAPAHHSQLASSGERS